MSKKKYGWCSLLDKELPLFGIGCYYCKHKQQPVIGSGDLRVCIFAQDESENVNENQTLLKLEDFPKPNPLVVLIRIAKELKEIDAEFEIKADGIIIKSRKKED